MRIDKKSKNIAVSIDDTYIIIGEADEQGRVMVDKYKLLPTDGEYDCLINGDRGCCKICGGVVEQKSKFSQKIAIEL